MSDKNLDIAGSLLAAGFGTAMLASHMMVATMVEMNKAARAGGLFGFGPFPAGGWTGAGIKAAASAAAVATEALPAEATKLRIVPRVKPAKEAADTAPAEIVPAETAPFAEPLAVEMAAAMTEFEEIADELSPAREPAPVELEAAEPETAEPEAAAPEAAEPETAAPETAETESASVEETSAAAAPEFTALSAARDGAGDDLRLIKGVGPKLALLLNDLGYYHFDQIAGWGPEELASVDAKLQGFAGRASRDNWIEQAKTLAEGGTGAA